MWAAKSAAEVQKRSSVWTAATVKVWSVSAASPWATTGRTIAARRTVLATNRDSSTRVTPALGLLKMNHSARDDGSARA